MTLFSYQAGNGVLHTLDPRVKLAALLALTITVFAAPPATATVNPALAGPAFVLLLGWMIEAASMGPVRTIRRVVPLLILAALIVLFRGASGIDYAIRFLIVAFLGDLTVAVTSRGRFIDAIAWGCSRLPRRTRAMVPLATAVALSSAPMLITVMHRAREACRVRGIRLRRHPRLTATRIARAALDDVPRQINRVSDAIVVRGFSLDPTPPAFQTGRGDAMLALLVMLAVAGSVWTAV